VSADADSAVMLVICIGLTAFTHPEPNAEADQIPPQIIPTRYNHGAMLQASILHSVSYAGLWGQHFLSLEDFIDKAAHLGFGGVMLMAKRPHLSVLDWNSAARARIRKRLEQHGLKTICIAGYNNFTADLEHGDIPQREYQIRHITELADMARDLGGNLVRVFTGYESSALPYTTQWNIVVDTLRECAQRASEYGVTIGVQNHHDIGAGTQSHYDLIQEVGEPNCRAMFDAWAPALHGEDIVAAARTMAAITVHTTVANYQLRPRYRYAPAVTNYEKILPTVKAVPIDEGFIDYKPFLRELEAGGYRGSVAYEMCSPLAGGGGVENLDRCARRFLDFIREYRASAITRDARSATGEK
jgi:sugar phosphate isomerase/epimerase